MALLRQMQPLVSIMALGIGLGLIGNSFGTIPTSGSALFGFGATILAGATMGLIGGGGSILTVPILVYLLGIPPVLATGYSLFVVGLSALRPAHASALIAVATSSGSNSRLFSMSLRLAPSARPVMA